MSRSEIVFLGQFEYPIFDAGGGDDDWMDSGFTRRDSCGAKKSRTGEEFVRSCRKSKKACASLLAIGIVQRAPTSDP
jgi:hypothetical protein